MLKAFVGTSGWLYDWNKGRTLDWYIENSGLNAIELNASFYRFPFPNQVKAWATKGRSLAWVVKVNRLVTHIHALSEKSFDTYAKFLELFRPLDPYISFYLLQMPPRFGSAMSKRVEDFAKSFNSAKMAFEFRHESWYGFDFSKLDFDGAIVSPDSPDVNGMVIEKNGVVYIRFHGRRFWYSYKYSSRELKDMADLAKKSGAGKVFAFFNNDHDMLLNAREFLSYMI